MSSSSLIAALEKNKSQFSPVVEFDSSKDSLVKIELTSETPDLNEEVFNDTKLFIQWINDKIRNAGARYGIGGFAEERVVYSFSPVFDAAVPGEEPRRFHLGMDIWGKPNTKVMAPADGIVHSFEFNDARGDYGGTIILSHHLGNLSYYTLYGHLSRSSLTNLDEGMRVRTGEVFAEFGIPSENGQWPPHLHFQIICDINGWKGDYPGVCRFSEKDEWLANSPDPDLILNLNRYLL